MRVYTRTGDKGETSLSDSSRIPKDDIRIESYGTVDELNCVLGICAQFLHELPEQQKEKLRSWFFAIQNDLFNLGADLATPIEKRFSKMIILDEIDVKNLELIIDECQTNLTPLRNFVLPGGTHLNSFLHLARTVCRRAERLVVKLSRNETINLHAISYLNRLSDLFFVLARWVLHFTQTPEINWSPKMGIRHCNLTNKKENG